MKKFIAIFLLFNFLLSSTEAHQLLRLPLVFQHYAEHKKEDKNMSFFEFLVMHYMSGSPQDEDYERDMQLPFKTCGDNIGSTAHSFVPLMAFCNTCLPVITEISEVRPVSSDNLPVASYCSGIWQPPRHT